MPEVLDFFLTNNYLSPHLMNRVRGIRLYKQVDVFHRCFLLVLTIQGTTPSPNCKNNRASKRYEGR